MLAGRPGRRFDYIPDLPFIPLAMGVSSMPFLSYAQAN
jgi:hypothetical protein